MSEIRCECGGELAEDQVQGGFRCVACHRQYREPCQAGGPAYSPTTQRHYRPRAGRLVEVVSSEEGD